MRTILPLSRVKFNGGGSVIQADGGADPVAAGGQLQSERRFGNMDRMIYVLGLVVALLLGVGVVSLLAKREARDVRGDIPRKGRPGGE